MKEDIYVIGTTDEGPYRGQMTHYPDEVKRVFNNLVREYPNRHFIVWRVPVKVLRNGRLEFQFDHEGKRQLLAVGAIQVDLFTNPI